jgi:hypothetical protein
VAVGVVPEALLAVPGLARGALAPLLVGVCLGFLGLAALDLAAPRSAVRLAVEPLSAEPLGVLAALLLCLVVHLQKAQEPAVALVGLTLLGVLVSSP